MHMLSCNSGHRITLVCRCPISPWCTCHTHVAHVLQSFLEGFHELVPPEMISIFTSQELELLISGMPDIDLDDLQVRTHGAAWLLLLSVPLHSRMLSLQLPCGPKNVACCRCGTVCHSNTKKNWWNPSHS